MTASQVAAWLTLPRHNGAVVDPRYLPEGRDKDDYIARLGKWCRANHRHDWPTWLAHFVDERRAAASRRPGDVGPAVPQVAEGGV